MFNKNEISIKSACEIDENLLIDFYKKVYPERIISLESNWKWLNGSHFGGKKTPIVIVYQNQVIAHLGMIPFKISLNGNSYSASWGLDIKVLPELQRQGLGITLTKEWMDFSDCVFGFPNFRSIGVFKKNGWIESFDTYMHLNFILPFNHPGFVKRLPTILRKILNHITYPIFYLIYMRHSYSKNNYQLEKLDEKSFADFFSLYSASKEISENTASPIRDLDYAKWRVLNSPNRDRYYIYKNDKISALVLLHNNHGEYIDVLWVSDTNNKIEIAKMISTLGIYGLKNGFSYIRFYTSKKQLSTFIKRKTLSVVKHPSFVYFSKNKSIFEKLKKTTWDIQLIDGDFEHIKERKELK